MLMKVDASVQTIRRIYDLLLDAFGPQDWWPGDTPTEVVIGAILTQNTAWINVEKAITALRAADALDFAALQRMPETELAELIRPAGTYRVKAVRLKAFVDWLMGRYSGDLKEALGGPIDEARRNLLAIPGIGPETADAILLYAGDRATFVVDAYTKRVLRRHFLTDGAEAYDAVKSLLEARLPRDLQLFNEFHALFVELGKRHCRSRARCDGCPLNHLAHDETL
jgi:endonuclease-3 related protein